MWPPANIGTPALARMQARKRTPSKVGNPVTTPTSPGTPAIAEIPATGNYQELKGR
jgi:hypothetical protein